MKHISSLTDVYDDTRVMRLQRALWCRVCYLRAPWTGEQARADLGIASLLILARSTGRHPKPKLLSRTSSTSRTAVQSNSNDVLFISDAKLVSNILRWLDRMMAHCLCRFGINNLRDKYGSVFPVHFTSCSFIKI